MPILYWLVSTLNDIFRESKEEIGVKSKVGRENSHGHGVKDVFREERSG